MSTPVCALTLRLVPTQFFRGKEELSPSAVFDSVSNICDSFLHFVDFRAESSDQSCDVNVFISSFDLDADEKDDDG